MLAALYEPVYRNGHNRKRVVRRTLGESAGGGFAAAALGLLLSSAAVVAVVAFAAGPTYGHLPRERKRQPRIDF